MTAYTKESHPREWAIFSSIDTNDDGKVTGVNEDVAKELAKLKLENKTLKKENDDLKTPDGYQTLGESAQNAKHLPPRAVGRTEASVQKHIKGAKSARKGKKQAEYVRREGLRSRTRSQTNSGA